MEPNQIYKIAYDLQSNPKINQQRNNLISFQLYTYIIDNFKDSKEGNDALIQIQKLKTSAVINFNEDLLTNEIKDLANKILDTKGEFYEKLKQADLQEEFYNNVRTIKNILMFFLIISIFALLIGLINIINY